MATLRTQPSVGLGDPSVLRRTESQLAQSAIIANGKSTVSNGEAIFVGTTLSVNTNNVTLTTSANNQPADIVTVYSSQGTTYVSAIDQTVKQTVINQTGVYEIVAGNGITISSTSAGGTGTVTINTTAGNIAAVNLDGNVSNVLRGNGSWGADANSSYGDSNVVSLLGAFGSNTIVTTGNITGGNIIGIIAAGSNTITTTGNITGGNLIGAYANGNSNVNIATANGNVIIAAVGNTTMTVTGTGANIIGTANISGNANIGNIGTGVITLTNGAVIKDNAGNAVAFGKNAGSNTQGNFTVAIGTSAGENTQGVEAVAIGVYAGSNTQGNSAVAIGAYAGYTNQANNSIILNATGANLNQTVANTFTVAPVRNDVANIGQVLFYNTTSKEVTYGNTISVAGNITAGSFVGNGGNITYQQTNTYYVDPGRTQNYTPSGTQIQPFFTITAAIAAAVAAGYDDTDPSFIVLMENITENVTLKPGIWLTSLGTGTHGSPNITGTVTVNSTTGTLTSNHYSISNLRIVAPSGGHGILFTGTAPQRLFVRDMWIEVSGTGTGDCIYTDNTGTGSTLHMNIAHLAHTGSGDVYCINVTKGNCYVTDIETSGSTQVAAVQTGAVMTIDSSELDANGDVVCETYGTGSLTITNSIITNIAINSNGIKINAAGSTVTVGQCLFSIPIGTGSVVYYNPAATLFGSNFVFASISFFPSTNTTIDARLVPIPLAVAVGTIASPILYGDITSYSVAQDWDLIDNNSSALSFDTTGKAGILNLVTTNSAEGVTMSGYANVTGNITGGNVITAGVVKSGAFVTGNIPAAATAGAGSRAFVTDATLATFGSPYVGGAANAVPVYSDGSAWFIG